MGNNKFLFSDIFWALAALIGIFIGAFFQDVPTVKCLMYLCSAVVVLIGLKGLYAFFNRKK